jgi:hypothetical protein
MSIALLEALDAAPRERLAFVDGSRRVPVAESAGSCPLRGAMAGSATQ